MKRNQFPRHITLFMTCLLAFGFVGISHAQAPNKQTKAQTKKAPSQQGQRSHQTTQRDAIVTALLQAFAQMGNTNAAPTPVTIKTKNGMTIQIADTAAAVKQLWTALTKRKTNGKKARVLIRTKSGKVIQFNDAGKSLSALLKLLSGK